MIKKVIFVNNVSSAAKIFDRDLPSRINLLQVVFGREAADLIGYFKDKKIEVRPIRGSDYIKDFERSFSVLIGQLNAAQGRDRFWWALNLTNKNPITTSLCNKTYYVLLIYKILFSLDDECLVIIDSDAEIYEQLKRIISSRRDIDIMYAGSRHDLKLAVQSVAPVAIIYRFFLALVQKAMASFYACGTLKGKEDVTVVMSLLCNPSFKNGQYCDVYFGPFVEYLKKNNIPFVNLMWVLDSYIGMLGKARRHGQGYNIYAKEYFISLWGIFVATAIAFKRYFSCFKVTGSYKIEGLDFTYLVNLYVRREYSSSRFFGNLIVFFAIKGAAQKASIKRFYYPFENRAFEKMMVLALRRHSPVTRIVGYQHASLSLRHTNFFLTEEELAVTPLPDVLMTTGDITKDIMSDIGNLPANILRSGCALRQSKPTGILKKRPAKVMHLLVALATGIDEYIKVLRFMDEAFGEKCPYEIWIRPHPVFSLEEAISLSGAPRFKFAKAARQSLEECFAWADAVLYVHSTVSLEAMTRGIPVINLGIDEPIDPDPLFGFKKFKWRANRPADLMRVIAEIDQLDEKEFSIRQKSGEEYANRYIKPVTEECLKAFLEC